MPARKKVIGLIGGIGSGKSAVARMFASLGCAIIDADELAHQVINEPGVRKQLVEWWGPGVVKADGTVDRQALGRKVFNHPDELRRLEGLTHPLINQARAALREKYQGDPDVVAIVEDTPLLLEKGLEGECDVLVFVEADLETRAARVAQSRGWKRDELARREKNQLPLDIKAKRADYVIDNNAVAVGCKSQVRRVLSQILQDQKPAT